MIPVLHGVWASGGLAGDFEHIETQTVGAGGAANITFSSIPQTYKHLQIRGLVQATFGSNTMDTFYVRLNSDTGSNYSQHGLYGNGTSAGSFGNASQTYGAAGYVRLTSVADSIFGANVIDILDYASTSKNKTVRGLGGVDANGSGAIILTSSVWLNSSTAVNAITLVYPAQTLRQYSTFSLYGVK